MNYSNILIIIITILILMLTTKKITSVKNVIINKPFYTIKEVNTKLENIKKFNTEIVSEVENIKHKIWHDWPEKELYDTKGTWKIFPFYVFGVWEQENCKLCPSIARFLSTLDGLKVATLSKMSPGMKLAPHQGWGTHSNNVIRCHYGIIVPKNKCYVRVLHNDKWVTSYQHDFNWILFDDSKMHYAENQSNIDRIVLIIDIERPVHIEKGKSQIKDTKELMEIVNYFKNKNKYL